MVYKNNFSTQKCTFEPLKNIKKTPKIEKNEFLVFCKLKMTTEKSDKLILYRVFRKCFLFVWLVLVKFAKFFFQILVYEITKKQKSFYKSDPQLFRKKNFPPKLHENGHFLPGVFPSTATAPHGMFNTINRKNSKNGPLP